MNTLGTGAAQLDLIFQIGSYRTIVFDLGIDISAWTFELVIRKNKGDRVKIISKTLGNGLSIPVYQTNQVQATFTASNTSIEEGEYVWEFRRIDIPIPIINGIINFTFDAPAGNIEEETLQFNYSAQTIELNVSNFYSGLAQEIYSTTLTFDQDKEVYKEATGLSITFTLGTGNVNGNAIILRLNKPTAVNFPSIFEADANSATLDSTKMNVFYLVFFTNWNGSGSDRVIYMNKLFAAV